MSIGKLVNEHICAGKKEMTAGVLGDLRIMDLDSRITDTPYPVSDTFIADNWYQLFDAGKNKCLLCLTR